MSGDRNTHPATRPGTSDGPARIIPSDTDQPEAPPCDQPPGDRLIGIREIRQLFSPGRTAAYELTHRDGFPARVPISSHACRWRASEAAAFAVALQHQDHNSPGRSQRRAQQSTLLREAAHRCITGTVRPARGRRTWR
jgi:predicted DNA-binding transcriptional regulator AlpA